MQYWFVTVVPKYFNFVTFSKDLSTMFLLEFHPAFWVNGIIIHSNRKYHPYKRSPTRCLNKIMKPLAWGGQGPYKDCRTTDDDENIKYK
jgi:hypothetical protein